MESDSKIAINLCADVQSRSELMPIFQEIKELSRAFASFSMIHTGREANQAAHACAKQASVDRKRCVWMNYNPGFLASTLLSDCNPI
jgi:hypothetical protein